MKTINLDDEAVPIAVERGEPEESPYWLEVRLFDSGTGPKTDFVAIRDILKPYDANLMRRYPVSRKLNNSKIDDAESASPVTLDTPNQERLF